MRETTKGKTVVFEERPIIFPIVFTGAGLLLAAYATGLVQGGDFTSGKLEWPPLLAACAMILAGLYFFRRERFAFDTFRKKLQWSRRSVFGAKSGTLAFKEIEDIFVETLRDTDGDTYRIALKTANGLLPFTTAYTGNRLYWEDAAQRMRAVLELAPPNPDALTRMLVMEGRVIDAVKQVRMEQGLSLAEAKAEVDRLRKELRV